MGRQVLKVRFRLEERATWLFRIAMGRLRASISQLPMPLIVKPARNYFLKTYYLVMVRTSERFGAGLRLQPLDPKCWAVALLGFKIRFIITVAFFSQLGKKPKKASFSRKLSLLKLYFFSHNRHTLIISFATRQYTTLNENDYKGRATKNHRKNHPAGRKSKRESEWSNGTEQKRFEKVQTVRNIVAGGWLVEGRTGNETEKLLRALFGRTFDDVHSTKRRKKKRFLNFFFSFDGVGNEIEKSCGVLLRIDRRNSVHARAVLDGLGHLGRLLLDAVVRQDVHQSKEVDLSLLRGGPRWDRVDVFLGVDFSSRGGRGGLFRASGWPGAGQRRVRRG